MTAAVFLWTLTVLPLLSGVACLACRSARAVMMTIRIGVVAAAAASGACVWAARDGGSISTAWGWLCLDALSAYHLAVMMVVFTLSSLYLPGYFREEIRDNILKAGAARRFGVLWFGALTAMTLVLLSNNIGIMWVGIEATTLVTAFLICIHRTLLWNTPSVMARFEETGNVPQEVCASLGLVGVPARACGMERDVRFEFPAGIYRFINIPVATWTSGDVFARAHVRWWEIGHSVAFIRERLAKLSDGPILTDPARPLAPNTMTVSLIEGWRGEICHTIITDEAGQIARYKVVDPSFHNWMGLAIALRGQQISDFPLCNKSFNLSYCGTDL